LLGDLVFSDFPSFLEHLIDELLLGVGVLLGSQDAWLRQRLLIEKLLLSHLQRGFLVLVECWQALHGLLGNKLCVSRLFQVFEF